MAQTEDFVTDSTNTGAGRGRSSEEIRSEIDRTRADMDETFAALDAKLTPSQIGLEAWRMLKGGSSAGAGKLWRIAKEHPMPTAVIGLGVGWLLVESARHGDGRAEDFGTYRAGYASDEYGEPGDIGDIGFDSEEASGRLAAAKDKVKDVASSAKETLADATDTVREKVGEATEWTRERTSRLGQRAKGLKGKAKTQTRRAKLGFWQSLEENPLLVGAASLALGLIAGLAVPSTEKEDELWGETRDRLLDEVKEAGQEVLDKGKHVAEAVADRAKLEAQNQGLTPEGVVEKVKTVAREAATTAKEEAKNQNLTPEAAVNRAKQAVGNARGVHEEEPELARR